MKDVNLKEDGDSEYNNKKILSKYISERHLIFNKKQNNLFNLDIYENIFKKNFIFKESYFTFDYDQISINLLRNVKNIEKRKIIGVLYSGGVDSTFLILDNIEKGNYVIPIMNCFNDNDENIFKDKLKYKMALYSIENIRKRFPKNISKPVKCMNISLNGLYGFTYTQQSFNSFSLFTLNNTLKFMDEIQIGTILEDQGVSYINEMKNAYKAGLKFIVDIDEDGNQVIETSKSNKFPSLKFPLIKYQKPVIRDLLEKYLRRMDLINSVIVFSCEDPKIEYRLASTTYKNKKCIYLKCIIYSCKENERMMKCHSCEHDLSNQFDKYYLYIKLENEDIDNIIKYIKNNIYKNNIDKYNKYIKMINEENKNFDKCKESNICSEIDNNRHDIIIESLNKKLDENEKERKKIKKIYNELKIQTNRNN